MGQLVRELVEPLSSGGKYIFITDDGVLQEHTIRDITRIGGGNYGEIYRVRNRVQTILHGEKIDIEGDGVLKQFLLRSDAERAKENHDLLKR